MAAVLPVVSKFAGSDRTIDSLASFSSSGVTPASRIFVTSLRISSMDGPVTSPRTAAPAISGPTPRFWPMNENAP